MSRETYDLLLVLSCTSQFRSQSFFFSNSSASTKRNILEFLSSADHDREAAQHGLHADHLVRLVSKVSAKTEISGAATFRDASIFGKNSPHCKALNFDLRCSEKWNQVAVSPAWLQEELKILLCSPSLTMMDDMLELLVFSTSAGSA